MKTNCHSCGGPLPVRGEKCEYCGVMIIGRESDRSGRFNFAQINRSAAEMEWFEDELLPGDPNLKFNVIDFDPALIQLDPSDGPLTRLMTRMASVGPLLTGVEA